MAMSRLALMGGGDGAEVGVVGMAVLLRAGRDKLDIMVQVPGTALRMKGGSSRCSCSGTARVRPTTRIIQANRSEDAPAR